MPAPRLKDRIALLFRNIVLVLVGAVALSACARDRSIGLATDIAVADLAGLPAPTASSVQTLGPQQSLEIVVAEAEMLSGTFVTDSDGYISYPLVGDLYLAGKTPRQVAKMIADRLRGEYVIDPQVRVRPTEVLVPSISVGGQVVRSGTYPAATSQTLLRAINNAGGLADYAKLDDVLVIRTVDGQRYIGVYNIEAIQRGNYDDPVIYPNDIVTVGDSVSRRNLEGILQFIPLLSTSVILIDRAFN